MSYELYTRYGYPEGTNLYEKLLVELPDAELYIKMQLAEVYKAQDDNHRALQEFERCLDILNKLSTLDKDKLVKMIEGQIENIKKYMK